MARMGTARVFATDSLCLLGVSIHALPTGAGKDGCLAKHPQA